MKADFFSRLRNAPQLRALDLWVTLLPGVLWILAVRGRVWIMETRCFTRPESCSPHSVFFLDRPALGLDQPGADYWSYVTQNSAGIMAIAIPLLWHAAKAIRGTRPQAALTGFATDFVLLLQTTLWNGLATEIARLIAQRPRPFVYSNLGLGAESANYTSFYSGHTSFAAAASVGLLLVLISRRASVTFLLLVGGVGQALVLLTGTYRVLAGRHFPTDVAAGAVGGTLVALIVAYSHRRKDGP
jgi:membrane-associated phospholipid phosphatase